MAFYLRHPSLAETVMVPYVHGTDEGVPGGQRPIQGARVWDLMNRRSRGSEPFLAFVRSPSSSRSWAGLAAHLADLLYERDAADQ